jgi:hypothetical protein
VTIAAFLVVSHATFTILPLCFEIDEFIQIRLSQGNYFPKQSRAAGCSDCNLHHG